jgi:hypothetical protein
MTTFFFCNPRHRWRWHEPAQVGGDTEKSRSDHFSTATKQDNSGRVTEVFSKPAGNCEMNSTFKPVKGDRSSRMPVSAPMNGSEGTPRPMQAGVLVKREMGNKPGGLGFHSQ